MSKEWYYYVGGEERGPVEFRFLKELAERGKLLPTDQVCRDGDDWSPAGSIRGLTFTSLEQQSQATSVAEQPSSSARQSPRFVYKMVQMNPDIEVDEGTSTHNKAA